MFCFVLYNFSYWPNIDDTLRATAFNKRHVKVKLLASYWNHTWDDMFMFLRSLDDLRKHYSGYSYGKSMSIEVVSDTLLRKRAYAIYRYFCTFKNEKNLSGKTIHVCSKHRLWTHC